VPSSFWKKSYFEDNVHSAELNPNNTSKKNCHGSSANMFGWPKPDYRMMMCAEVKDEDLIIFQHEMGHIMYFMAYEKLPTIFQVTMTMTDE
jgi:peptidyl-dipeptidase A